MRALLLSLYFFVAGLGPSVYAAELPQALVVVNGARFNVDVAADEPSIRRGLMGREQMDAGRGMLFVFPDQRVRSFWMKHTLIPLDIIYLDAEYRVVDMALQLAPCVTPVCQKYPSRGPMQYVLEINAGLAEANGLRVGDLVEVYFP